MSTLAEQQTGVAPDVSESGVKTVRKGTRSCTECMYLAPYVSFTKLTESR